MYDDISKKAKNAYSRNKELIKRLRHKPPVDLDNKVRSLQKEFFKTINCLDCARCCKELGPRISDKDISRISAYLKIKPSQFSSLYLKIDEDGDYVFKRMPCPFLLSDNFCSIYKVRPSACSDYPHLDRNRIHQVLDISLKNSFICPVVFEVLESLRKE